MAYESKTTEKEGAGEDTFIKTVRKNYERAIDYERENREECLDDLRFRAGEQWAEEVKRDRLEQRRPILTINRIPQYTRQVTGDIRLNKPAIKVRPVDDGADKDTAELFTGLIRNIEQQSMASSVYVTGADNMATCGQGAWRVVTEYADDDSFEQDIRIRRIRNPFAVVWDPDSQEPTREDAKYCFVLQPYAIEDFKQRWPNASLTDFEIDQPEDWVNDWRDGEQIIVAEYWCKKPVKKKLAALPDGSIRDVTALTEPELAQMQLLQDAMAAEAGEPSVPIRFRDVDSMQIEQHFVNGAESLEEPYIWPGRYIPIVPVLGEEVNVADRVVRHGLVRFLKDPQRLYNYDRSAAVETISLAPKSPFVASIKQIEGFEDVWDTANTENHAYLPYNPDPAAGGPPQRQPAAQVPAALVQDAQISADDMSAVSGIYPSSLGQESNETSGKAILARERQGDVGTFVYIDNLAISIAHTGKILVDLIPRIYDSERVIRVLGEDDSEDLVTINRFDPMTGKMINDLSVGKYDVAVQTGPSFSTKRQEAADSILQFMQTMPQAAQMVMHKLVKNLDWPEADDIAETFRKMAVAQGIEEPDEDKGDQPPAPPPPSPEEIKAQTDAAQAEAGIAKTEAETEGVQLESAQAAVELALTNGTLQRIVESYVNQILTGSLGAQPPPTAAPQPTQEQPPPRAVF
ncbi:hypothetical protein HBA54_04205 [Pelagibius litoralis]|uniref:Phage P22-like portal protein n=1 Tax=Pelagibius litoralis TaxID=374515 RepID=A0A967C3T7_9PROT|nr:portal protein [Pelagibius litoralis]NIA67785.1 hypothetical protein [Pelagibius litoralis]